MEGCSRQVKNMDSAILREKSKSVSSEVFVIILGLAAGVTMLGSALPLRRAAHFQPAPILRGE